MPDGPRLTVPAPRTAHRGGALRPERHEADGGWGAPPATPAHGVPAVPRPRMPEPAGGGYGDRPGAPGMPGAVGADGFGAAAGPGGAGTLTGQVNGPSVGGSSPSAEVAGNPLSGSGQVPGPRREYVEAFAEDRDRGGDGDGGDTYGGRVGDAPGGRPPVTDTADAADGAEPLAGADTGGRKGTKGRTLTGVAAAAVTTVLAVVVAGQVADQHADGGAAQASSGQGRVDGTDGQASRSQARPTKDAAPVTYDEKMAHLFPLAEKMTARGTFTTVGRDAKAPGRGQVLRYRVDIEDGLPLDGELFADAVHKTLNDDRSWAHDGRRTFQRVGSGHADFVITLASPGTTAVWCAKSGLDTSEENVSCDSAATERVMINAYRWAEGATTYSRDELFAYRQMLINHEVGHRLGHNHEGCTKQGALAPVMMQQTKFLTTKGLTCRPNSWPFPTER
ncbi:MULTISPECIES: DUF3152 domain-containing protein [Streptomyces]|uniref:DUF3152 domain-containing protein n=1 Tax=Streptomyces TaxID=1883 RepID=UPI00069AF59C|nr:DUF3152 domain-containing protein [Streptomyces sp. SID7805]MYU52064.1 DUF3152 domain-containing protein [Streptomyces sp. SID7805]